MEDGLEKVPSFFRGFAFGRLDPVLGFTREQVIRNFAFGELEVEPSHEVLDCRRRPRSDRDKIRGRSGKLTLWLRNGLTGDWNGQGVDTESAEDEGGEKGFGEHDDRECREEEQIATAPGLKLGRWGRI